MKQPFYQIVIAYIVGIIIGKIISFPIWYLVICFILFVAGILYFLHYSEKKDISILLILSLIALFGVFRINVAESNQSRKREIIGKLIGLQRLEIEGEIASDPVVMYDSIRFQMGKNQIFFKDVIVYFEDKINVIVKSSAVNAFKDKKPTYGDKIRISEVLRLPKEATTEGLFDYKDYLEQQDVYAVIVVKYPQSILDIKLESKPFETILKMKHSIENYFYGDMENKDASLLLAILFGQQLRLDKTQKDKYIRCGIMHIFAVSGQQIGIAILIFFMTMRILQVKQNIASGLTIGFIILYAMLTGFNSSVMRASIVGICYMISFMIKREINSYNVLSFSAFILLLYDPRLLLNPGFQLSFVAVLGILLLTRLLTDSFRFKPFNVSNLLFATIAAQVFVLPLVVYYFNVMSIIGYLSNLLIAPFLFGIIYTAFFSLIFGFVIHPLGSIFNVFNSYLLYMIQASTDFFSSLPFAAINYPNLSFLAMFAYYFAVGLLLYKWNSEKWSKVQKRARLVILALVLILILFINFWIAGSKGLSGELKITFLDVGQGDCIYFEFPDGRNMIVDGGPPPAGKYIIDPFLKDKGVNSIDYMVLTHPDADHLSGLCDVIKNFNVESVIANGAIQTSDEYMDFLKYIKSKKINFKIVRRWDEIDNFNPAKIFILHPDEENFDIYSSNSKSVVFKLIYKDFSILMCGDIESDVEYNILRERFDLKSDVIKIPHHGSSTSSTMKFLERVKPKIAIIEVGQGNRFGHPQKEVLERLEKTGAKIYRTDLNGTIELITDGHKIKIKTTKNASDNDS